MPNKEKVIKEYQDRAHVKGNCYCIQPVKDEVEDAFPKDTPTEFHPYKYIAMCLTISKDGKFDAHNQDIIGYFNMSYTHACELLEDLKEAVAYYKASPATDIREEK